MHVGTESGNGIGDNNALFAHNPTNTDFAGRTAFFDVDALAGDAVSVCGDRQAFLGPDGSLRRPGAMDAARLCGAVGFALGPCAALRVDFRLDDGQTREIVFRLGAGTTPEEARTLVQRWRGAAAAREALAAVKQHWTHALGAVQVRTPDKSQGHHVLQLIAKAEGAARLVDGITCPQPAGQRLVSQPAIGQQVEGTSTAFSRTA